MKTTQKFWIPMAVLGLMAGIMFLNPNPAYADGPGSKKQPVFQKCPDGIKQGTEQCDDDNDKAGDGCSPICEIEVIAPTGPMTVEKIEAGTVKADHIETGTENVGQQNVGNSRVATQTVEGDFHLKGDLVIDTKARHTLSILGSYGTSMGDPWMARGVICYRATWGLLGISASLGVGGWEKYGESLASPLVSFNPNLTIGNEHGGGEFGVELFTMAPLAGHKSGEGWENLVMVRAGGWYEVSWFTLRPWMGIVVYEPKNPSAPPFDPKFFLGLDIGGLISWEPKP